MIWVSPISSFFSQRYYGKEIGCIASCVLDFTVFFSVLHVNIMDWCRGIYQFCRQVPRSHSHNTACNSPQQEQTCYRRWTSWAIPIVQIMDILPIFPAQHPSVLPIVYNHVQALVIGLDVIFLHSGNFIASSGFPISPYPSSPCCMYFLLGVKSLFFIWSVLLKFWFLQPGLFCPIWSPFSFSCHYLGTSQTSHYITMVPVDVDTMQFLPSALNVTVKKFNQVWVNGRSNYDSLKVAKCLVM